MFEHLREESLAALVEMDFPGYAVGGVSVGEPKEDMLRIMAHTPHKLPANKPRYLMGVARRKTWSKACARRGHVRLRDAHSQRAQRPHVHPLRRPEDPQRQAPQRRAAAGRNLHLLHLPRHDPPDGSTSGGFSRAYMHHLERCGEMLAPMLATIHNLHYYLNLMKEVRESLEQGGSRRSCSNSGRTARAACNPLRHSREGGNPRRPH
jgi:queuine tRNA-ribosyltransferase